MEFTTGHLLCLSCVQLLLMTSSVTTEDAHMDEGHTTTTVMPHNHHDNQHMSHLDNSTHMGTMNDTDEMGGHHDNTEHQGMDGHGSHDNDSSDPIGSHGDHGNNNEESSHSQHQTTGHVLYFFFSVDTIILFSKWTTSTWRSLLGSCFGIGAIAAAYEGLKFFREYLMKSVGNNHEKYSLGGEESCCTFSCTCMHLLQVVLHMVQVAVSYGLMLVFMTFNVWLCLAVIIGAGIGYLLFGWKQRHTAQALEHCN